MGRGQGAGQKLLGRERDHSLRDLLAAPCGRGARVDRLSHRTCFERDQGRILVRMATARQTVLGLMMVTAIAGSGCGNTIGLPGPVSSPPPDQTPVAVNAVAASIQLDGQPLTVNATP